jgi:hypothetical protein
MGRCEDVPVGGTDAHRLLVDSAATYDGDATDVSNVAQPPATLSTCRPSRLAEVAEEVRREVGERNWRFFWRTAVDGQSAAEVGEESGVTANTVRIVKMRVLRRLRERLSAETETQ